MNLGCRSSLIVVLSAATTVGAAFGEQAAAPKASLREILGVAHVAGAYNPGGGTQDFLNKGAEDILALGSQTIKVWFADPATSYPFNSQWPERFDTLVEMAKHPYYRALFDKPFRHYILLTYSLGRPEHYWANGISDAEKADEQQQFHALAKYLLTAYRGTGKTFILQHWEGDWAIRGHYDSEKDPVPGAFEGMAAWLNARQAGVDQARGEVSANDVHVYHAAEVNLVLISMNNGRPGVTNRVLPHTNLDLVSYSCWDAVSKGEELRRALDYIAAQMPDRAPFGNKNVYLGEYGWPESDAPMETVQAAVRNAVNTAIDWGCPYAIYWETYCNEPKRKPVEKNEDARGFWLIKPDGSKAWAWQYLHGVLTGPNDSPAAEN